jgi:DNA replication factor GINS
VSLNLIGRLMEEEMLDNALKRIPQDTYRSVALYLKDTRNSDQLCETLAAHLKLREKELLLNLTLNLLRLRLSKAKRGKGLQEANLLPEERYILEAEEQAERRLSKIVNALKNGQLSLLTSIEERHIRKLVTLRFLRAFDAIIGVDLRRYGPFKPEDVATIPLENAKPLVEQGVAVEIWLDE